ncbi:hypothetical protein GDO81_006024 [Engystomops pustulosus]|uniref:CCHC-type domain-containing protein n=1 Tax=Engystomops pustulosus TaxID=76066 RepID=A0AAV7CTU1_ENGPU|nr:hypothetical protein GDO81_006024 [Engystomops pustulosus]
MEHLLKYQAAENKIKDGKEKISLSMKVVHQGTGKDLDSNNVVLEQDERKRREFRDYSKQKITLEAVLNTVCKKCGCKGHFAKDCFMQPGGTKYSLVPDDEEEDAAGNHKKTEKHHKKQKKEKKRKMHRKDKDDSSETESSGSESSDSEPSRKKRRHGEKSKKTSKKKKKKHKKHKQRD